MNIVSSLPASVLTKSQKLTFGPVEYADGGNTYRITAGVRHDDECGNGHNSFAITGEIERKTGRGWVYESGGCVHNEIAKHFPHLAPLIKWHLTSTDGPMHYVANTLYHASNRDYRGLLKGEKQQLRNGKTGLPVWERVMRNDCGDVVNGGSNSWTESNEKPAEKLAADWEPVWVIGEGKERDLDAARASAVWPDATDAELMADDLEAKLVARLHALVADFKAAVESLGLVY